MESEIPLACSLTDGELQARRKNYLDKAAARLVDSTEIENGFRFRFPLETPVLRDLTEIIDLERRCCPFLNFRLGLEAGSRFVTLEMTGREGAKEMVRSLFGWNER
jgi:hypothetical protein